MVNKVILAAHVLPAEVRHHAMALSEANLLDRLYTGYVYLPDGWMESVSRLLPPSFNVNRRLQSARPSIRNVPSGLICRSPLTEAARILAERTLSSDNRWCDITQSIVARKAAQSHMSPSTIVMGREMEALELFQAAKRRGLERIYQLPIAHFQTLKRVLNREYDTFPNICTKVRSTDMFGPKRLRRKEREIELASRILVPSKFVADSLIQSGVSSSQIKILPFGCEPEWANVPSAVRTDTFLHVGQLSLRKGTHRLLRVWKRLGAHRSARLRLIGKMYLSDKFLRDHSGCYEYLGKLPRAELKAHYASSCCFVLPALAEGFAIVVLEALSTGTPVVVSRNTGAEGFMEEGVHGRLHDAQNDEQLAEALEWMLTHRKEREEMGQHARDLAKSWTWTHYRREFIEFITQGPASSPESSTFYKAT